MSKNKVVPLTPEMRARLKIASSLNIAAFQELMVAEGKERPDDHVALAALHKARVFFAEKGYLGDRIRRDSMRWLEMNGCGRWGNSIVRGGYNNENVDG